MKKLKFLLIPLLLLAFGAAFFLFLSKGSDNNSSQPLENQNVTATPIQSEKVNITVDFGNNEALYKSFKHQESQTAFSLLESLADMGLVDIETQQYDFGVFVKSINGYESSAEMSWIYFVNGKSGAVAADQYMLNPGDLVEWRYIEPSAQESTQE